MTSDDSKAPADTKFRHAGIGMSTAFLCLRCNVRRQSIGRRLQLVRGLRTWVCAGCAEAKK